MKLVPLTGPRGLMVPPGMLLGPKVATPVASGMVSGPAPPSALVKMPFASAPSVYGIRAGRLWPVKPSVVLLPLVLLKIPARRAGGGGGGVCEGPDDVVVIGVCEGPDDVVVICVCEGPDDVVVIGVCEGPNDVVVIGACEGPDGGGDGGGSGGGGDGVCEGPDVMDIGVCDGLDGVMDIGVCDGLDGVMDIGVNAAPWYATFWTFNSLCWIRYPFAGC
jgi:hypothetical protein